jgi:hypothetical protein
MEEFSWAEPCLDRPAKRAGSIFYYFVVGLGINTVKPVDTPLPNEALRVWHAGWLMCVLGCPNKIIFRLFNWAQFLVQRS